VHQTGGIDLDVKPKGPWTGALSPLGSCHQIHHEALHIAYAACFFDISFAKPLELAASQKHIDLVQNVAFRESFFLRFIFLRKSNTSICHFPGMVRVVVECPSSKIFGVGRVEDDVRGYFDRPSLDVEVQEE